MHGFFKTERQRELRCWNFECGCRVCSLPPHLQMSNDFQRTEIKRLSEKISLFVKTILMSLDKRLSRDSDNEEDRSNNQAVNCDIIVNIKDFINLAERRLALIQNLGSPLTMLLFFSHLECYFLYTKAKSLNIVVVDHQKRTSHHVKTLEKMSSWNIDWRFCLCNFTAKSFLLQTKWTYGSSSY